MSAASSTPVSLLWGLVDGRLFYSTAIDSSTAPLLQAAGWNPPLPQRQPAAHHVGGDDSSSSGPAAAAVTQLVVGWRHALLLLSDGRAFICNSSDCWTKAGLHAGPGSVSCPGTSSPWQPLQLPAHEQDCCQQQQQHQHLTKQQHQNQQQQHLQLELQHHPQLQLPGPSPSPAPSQAVVQVAAGDRHCLLLSACGSVWALGCNKYGQVGCLDGTGGADSSRAQPQAAVEVCQPVLVLGPGSDSPCQEAVSQVAAGSCHSVAVTAASGRLYCWGWNAHGQCCSGSTANLHTPALCEALDGVPLAAAAAGMAHTVCVSRDGAVYACGWNSNGQLGTARRAGGAAGRVAGPQQGSPTAEAAAAAAAAAAAPGEQRELVCVSSLRPELVDDPQLEQEHAVQVACGSRHTLVLTASGSVFAWGWNKYRQCCCGSEQDTAADLLQPRKVVVPGCQAGSQAVAVFAGRWHSVIRFKERL